MELTTEIRNGVALVTLNRPEAMNALSRSLRGAIVEVFRRLDQDAEVRSIVLTGAGERAFSAGLDLRELEQDVAVLTELEGENGSTNPVKAVSSCSKPVIGAINGVAITGGFELAIACDILVLSEHARFADTHAKLGVMPGWGLSQKLSRLIGPGRAKELSFSGKFIAAHEAVTWGLGNRVLPAAELVSEALKLAGSVAQMPPAFIARYKSLIDYGYEMTYGEALALEASEARHWNAVATAETVGQSGRGLLSQG